MERRAFLASLFAAGAIASVADAYPTIGQGGAKRAVLTFPGTPYMVHSVVRYRGWFGPCLVVRHGVTSATKEIGFRNNVLDWATLKTFLGDQTGYVTKMYDQTGNGRHLAQATTGNQPAIRWDNAVKGVVPVSIDGSADGTLAYRGLELTGISLSSQSLTHLQWVALNNSFNWGIIFEYLNSTPAVRMNMYLIGNYGSNYLDLPGISTNDNTTVNRSAALVPRVDGCMIGITSSASALIHQLDGSTASYAATPANTLDRMGLGSERNGNTLYGFYNLFCNVVYSSVLTATEVAVVRSQMRAAFERHPSPKTQVIFDGTSAWTGYQTTALQTNNWFFMQYASKPVAVYNMCIWGQLLQKCKDNFTVNITPLITLGSYARRVYFNMGGPNDMATQGKTGAQTYQLMKDCWAAARAIDANIVRGTTTAIISTGLSAPIQAEFAAFNVLVRAGVGTDFELLVDGLANDTRIDVNDTACAPDGNHFSTRCQRFAQQDWIAMFDPWLV